MNDLEHDLKDLFATKATSIDVAPGAPADVLRRGRRRETLTAVVGGLGVAAVIAVVAGVMLTRGGEAVLVPVGDPEADRHAIIGGLEIDAPADWTLKDLWPLAPLIGTSSESCSFEGTGTPVGPGGNDDDQVVTADDPVCIEGPSAPGGLPVFQASNVDRSLLQILCPIGVHSDLSVVADDVDAHFYVGYFAPDTPLPTPEDLTVCSGSTQFVGTADGGSLLLVHSAGPAASDRDVELLSTMASRILEQAPDAHLTPPDLGERPGPGYVAATDTVGDERFQIEVTLTLDPTALETRIETAAYTFDADGELTDVVTQPWTTSEAVSGIRMSDGWVLVGVVPPGTASAAWRFPDGTTVDLHIARTPHSIQLLVAMGGEPVPDASPVWGAVQGVGGSTLEGELVLG